MCAVPRFFLFKIVKKQRHATTMICERFLLTVAQPGRNSLKAFLGPELKKLMPLLLLARRGDGWSGIWSFSGERITMSLNRYWFNMWIDTWHLLYLVVINIIDDDGQLFVIKICALALDSPIYISRIQLDLCQVCDQRSTKKISKRHLIDLHGIW